MYTDTAFQDSAAARQSQAQTSSPPLATARGQMGMQGPLPIGGAPRTPYCAGLDMQVQHRRLSMDNFFVTGFEGGSCVEAGLLVWRIACLMEPVTIHHNM